MTRRFRAIRFPRAASTIFTVFTAFVVLLAAGDAFADDMAQAPISAQALAEGGVATTQVPGGAANTSTTPNETPVVVAGPAARPGDSANLVPGGAAAPSASSVTGGTADVASSAPNATGGQEGVQLLPSVERPLHRLYCVEYARLRSGFQIFGDAKLWWTRAQNAYAKLTQPVTDAVMVFAGSKRIRRGHVAVVTQIVSPREIRVDQANWQNHGEIDHATPVLDVSPNNDWSAVRVWDMASGQFGVRVYAIKGFIARALAAQSKT